MSTLGALKATIADDLARSDLTTQIAAECERIQQTWTHGTEVSRTELPDPCWEVPRATKSTDHMVRRDADPWRV